MAATIIPPSPQGYDIGAGLTPPSGRFAFEYGGNQYVVGQQGGFASPHDGDLNIHLMKSIDGGFTWNEVSPGTAPAVNDVGFSVGLDGSLVILMALEPGGGGAATGVATYTIDSSSGTPVWSGASTHTISSLATAASSGGYFLRLVVRGPSDYLVIYSGTKEVVSGTHEGRVYFVTWNGISTWGTETLFPDQAGIRHNFGAISAEVDGSGNTYVLAQNNDNTDNMGNVGFGEKILLWIVTGSTSAPIQYVAPYAFWHSEPGTLSELIIYTPSGGPETMAFVGEFNDDDTGNTQGIYFYSAPTGATPTWTGVPITTGLVDNTNSLGSGAQYSTVTGLPVPQDNPGWCRAISLVDGGGTLQATWCVTLLTGGVPFGYFYYSVSADTGTPAWSAPALLFASPVLDPGVDAGESNQVFSYYMSAGIAVLGCTQTATTFAESAQFFTSATPTAIPSYAW